MANSFLNRHLSEMMNQQLKDLSSYIGLQQQLSDDKLKQEEKEELKQKSQALLNNIADNKASLNVNLLSGVESFAKQVKEDWAQYTEPALNCTQFIHEYEKDIAKDPTKKLSDDAVITTKHVSTGMRWEGDGTEKKLTSTLLQFAGDITLDLLTPVIIIGPVSRVLDWNATLRALIAFAKEKGFTRKDISYSIKLIVEKYLPYFYSSIQFETDPDLVWQTSSLMVDYNNSKQVIKNKMAGVTREVGQDISGPLRTVRSLAAEQYKLEGPLLSDKDISKLADKHAMRCIPKFIEKEAYAELVKYKLQQKTRFNQDTDLAAQLSFISQIEAEPAYQLLSAKRLGVRQLDVESNNMSLNVVDTDAVDSLTDAVGNHEPYENLLYANEQETIGGLPAGPAEHVAGTGNGTFPFSRPPSRTSTRPSSPRPQAKTSYHYDTRARAEGPHQVQSKYEWGEHGVPKGGNVISGDKSSSWLTTSSRTSNAPSQSAGKNYSVSSNERSRTRSPAGRGGATTSPGRTSGGKGRNPSRERSRGGRSSSRGRNGRKSLSPLSRRPRIMVRDNSREPWRSVSRSKMGVRNADGRVRQRPLSKSPGREVPRCQSCGRRHAGECSSPPSGGVHGLMPFNFLATEN